MTRDQITMAQRILETMSRLNNLKEEIENKYCDLDCKVTQERVAEFLTFVIQSGFRDLIFDAVFDIRKKIDENIEQLEKELEAL